jgi:thiol-disulfide isomerase/thioredoxin
MLPSNVRASARPMVLGVILFSWLGACDSTVAPPPPASLSELFGSTLVLADGTVVGIEALEGKALIAIYFGARGCPACAVFTPLLVDAYEELREAGRSFEVVYVSSDGNAESMHQYMLDAGMRWLALPWGGSHSAALGQRYGVRWIPTVIVVDGAGATVSLKGYEEVASRGAAAYDDWLARSGGG